MKPYAFLIGVLLLLSCDDIMVPKPKAFLSLEYPKAAYHESPLELPFKFKKNKIAQLSVSKKNNKLEGIILRYPMLKASVFINYKKVNNNLETLLSDARKMTQKHYRVADEISERSYDYEIEKIYGMLYDLKGNVASQSQFYITDSLHHFVSGALYFETKPNYDSILPAINYVQKDIMYLIENLRWN